MSREWHNFQLQSGGCAILLKMSRYVPLLPIELLRELLDYDRDTGIFRWKVQVSIGVGAGSIAGYLDGKYWNLRIRGHNYRAHRVAWALTEGEWPPGEIDHRNRNRSDNRRSNLRLATHAENTRNCGLRRDNSSGVKGVEWYKATKKWRVSIRIGGKRISLGYFPTIEEAAAVRREADLIHYG